MDSIKTENSTKINFDIHQSHIRSVLDILSAKTFCYSAEIIPPRNGTDFLEVFSHIEKLEKSDFDFISVTHGAGGSLRGGTLPIAFHSQNVFGMTSIAHLTCRGMTIEDIENVLIDHHYFGIHNILALRGDPPDGIQLGFKPVDGGFSYAFELVKLIKNLNAGKYLVRKGYDDKSKESREGMKTRFCIGVACYPEDPNGKDIDNLVIKRESGADFAISQLVFDFEAFANFYDKVTKLWGEKFPILPGIRVPNSFKQLKRMREKFGVKIPDTLYNAMEKVDGNEEAMVRVGEAWAIEFVNNIKKLGIKGIHFFIMGNPDYAIKVKQG